MNTASSSPPRSRRLQFSLRLLLLGITAFAIGFPIWYRWPYEETRVVGPGATVTTVWQRQFGGERLKHGRETRTQGKLVQSSNYRRGKSHGPYMLSISGEPIEEGQFVDGKREGVWKRTFKPGTSWATTARYHQGLLDGTLEAQLPNGITSAAFVAGRLVSLNGRPVEDHLFDVLKSGVMDERTTRELKLTTDVDFVETPLFDVAEYLSDKHNLKIIADTKTLPEPDLPITAAYAGIELGSVLTLLTEPQDLACDYRYGSLWITTAEDAKNWHDPTGVSNIMPPKNSALAKAWNEPVPLVEAVVERGPSLVSPPVGIVGRSASQILVELEQRLNITIDNAVITPASWVRRFVTLGGSTEGLPFRHVLGQLLYFTDCRCELEGDKLVILPPEE